MRTKKELTVIKDSDAPASPPATIVIPAECDALSMVLLLAGNYMVWRVLRYARDAKRVQKDLALKCKHSHSRVVFSIYMIQNLLRNMIGSLTFFAILQCAARKMTEPRREGISPTTAVVRLCLA